MSDRLEVVLVVDDDQLALELAIEILSSAGYRATGASTVATALASVRASPPDLVVLDMNLGPEDGLDVARQLRQDPTTDDIPIVAASASTFPADRDRARSAGCDSYLSKPLRPRAFLESVRSHLGGG